MQEVAAGADAIEEILSTTTGENRGERQVQTRRLTGAVEIDEHVVHALAGVVVAIAVGIFVNQVAHADFFLAEVLREDGRAVVRVHVGDGAKEIGGVVVPVRDLEGAVVNRRADEVIVMAPDAGVFIKAEAFPCGGEAISREVQVIVHRGEVRGDVDLQHAAGFRGPHVDRAVRGLRTGQHLAARVADRGVATGVVVESRVIHVERHLRTAAIEDIDIHDGLLRLAKGLRIVADDVVEAVEALAGLLHKRGVVSEALRAGVIRHVQRVDVGDDTALGEVRALRRHIGLKPVIVVRIAQGEVPAAVRGAAETEVHGQVSIRIRRVVIRVVETGLRDRVHGLGTGAERDQRRAHAIGGGVGDIDAVIAAARGGVVIAIVIRGGHDRGEDRLFAIQRLADGKLAGRNLHVVAARREAGEEILAGIRPRNARIDREAATGRVTDQFEACVPGRVGAGLRVKLHAAAPDAEIDHFKGVGARGEGNGAEAIAHGVQSAVIDDDIRAIDAQAARVIERHAKGVGARGRNDDVAAHAEHVTLAAAGGEVGVARGEASVRITRHEVVHPGGRAAPVGAAIGAREAGERAGERVDPHGAVRLLHRGHGGDTARVQRRGAGDEGVAAVVKLHHHTRQTGITRVVARVVVVIEEDEVAQRERTGGDGDRVGLRAGAEAGIIRAHGEIVGARGGWRAAEHSTDEGEAWRKAATGNNRVRIAAEAPIRVKGGRRVGDAGGSGGQRGRFDHQRAAWGQEILHQIPSSDVRVSAGTPGDGPGLRAGVVIDGTIRKRARPDTDAIR